MATWREAYVLQTQVESDQADARQHREGAICETDCWYNMLDKLDE